MYVDLYVFQLPSTGIIGKHIGMHRSEHCNAVFLAMHT